MEEKISILQNKIRDGNSMINVKTHFQNLSRMSDKEINILELKCLKSNKEISTPVRGADCNHLECYDEKTLLDFFKSNESFLCNLCENIISEKNLFKDQFLYIIMKNKQYKNGMSIKISKSSGTWSYINFESIASQKTVIEGDIEEMWKYISNIKNDADADFIIYPHMNSEKLSLSIFINTYTSSKFQGKFIVCTSFNFARKNYIYTANDRENSNNTVKNYINFFHKIEKYHRDDKNILPLIMNEIYIYVLFIINIRSYPIFTIDYHFLELIKFCNSHQEFYFISILIRILTEIIRVEDFIIVLLLKSEEQLKKFSAMLENNFINCEEIYSKVKLFKEIDFEKEKQYDINSCIKKSIINRMQYFQTNSQINDLENKSDIFKIISNETCYTKSKFFDEEKINYGENTKFNDSFNKFSITTEINKELIDILSSNNSKYLISSDNLIYSNFTYKKEDNTFCPIEINLDTLSYFVCSNYNDFRLIDQLKSILAHQNYILTNLKELNSTISLLIIESKLDCIQLLNILTTTKQKKQNFIIFVNNILEEELKEILYKFNFCDNPNYQSESNVVCAFHDEFEFCYFFILEKENICDEIFYEEFEKIFTELKNNKISVSNFCLRNKMVLMKENMFYEIRKLKEK